MKKRNKFKEYLNLKSVIRFRALNVFISISFFILTSFLFGLPLGNKAQRDVNFKENYNFKFLENLNQDYPEIDDFLSLELKLDKSFVLKSAVSNEVRYFKELTINQNNSIKNILFVVDLKDKPSFDILESDIFYDPKVEFNYENSNYIAGQENYLLLFSNEKLYFQAHKFGIELYNTDLELEIIEIHYKSMMKDFDLSNLLPDDFGTYILNKVEEGYKTKLKIDAYTLAFIIVILFTFITITLLWLFLRNTSILTEFNEFYNIAAIVNIPIAILFFILLWFYPSLIKIYIFVFSIVLIFTLAKINETKEII